jgi:translation initiation factor IF-1
MSGTEMPVLRGAMVELGPNLLCTVRLDDGREVQARIPMPTARLMLRVVPGDRVKVAVRETGEFRVLGHEWVRT